MPRPKQEAGGLVSAVRNTRKRGCSSSSSASSSVLQNSGFKRAILVGRRGGARTPFPTWMIKSRSPCSTAAGVSECSQFGHSHASGKDKQAPVSARKLATALWELNEVSKPKMMGNLKEERREKTGVRGREDTVPRSAHWRSLPPHLSDPSHSPVSEAMGKSRIGNHRRGVRSVSRKLGVNGGSNRTLGFGCSDGTTEMETLSQDLTVASSAMGVGRSHLKDLSSSLTTFKQLLKLLDHAWDLHDHHSSTASLFPVLHSVLEQACFQVARLMEEQRRSGCSKIDHLKRCFMEEKAAWRSMFQDRMKSAMQPLVDELMLERRLRRRAERRNRRFETELTETRDALENVRKELETERRSREVIERICHEVVRGVEEDKARLEQVKRESAMAREELEKEREMLQLADTWREQRVQMKLSEAKHQFEEKNAAIDQLRNELKAFLPTNLLAGDNMGFVKRGGEQEIVGEGLKHLGKNFSRIPMSADGIREEGEVEDGEEAEGKDDEVNSTDSDLRSIELNMDNSSKSYRWSYAGRSAQANGKVAPPPLEEELKDRSFLGRKNMSWGSFPPEKDMSEDTGWGSGDRDLPHLGEVLHEDRPTYQVGNPENLIQLLKDKITRGT